MRALSQDLLSANDYSLLELLIHFEMNHQLVIDVRVLKLKRLSSRAKIVQRKTGNEWQQFILFITKNNKHGSHTTPKLL